MAAAASMPTHAGRLPRTCLSVIIFHSAAAFAHHNAANHAPALSCRMSQSHFVVVGLNGQARLYSVTPRQIIQMVWRLLILENTFLASQMPSRKSANLFEQIEFFSSRLQFGVRLAFCEFPKPCSGQNRPFYALFHPKFNWNI